MTPEEFEAYLIDATDRSIHDFIVKQIVAEVAGIVIASSMDSDLCREWIDVALAEQDCD